MQSPSYIALKPHSESLIDASLREGGEIERGTIRDCVIDELQTTSELYKCPYNLQGMPQIQKNCVIQSNTYMCQREYACTY